VLTVESGPQADPFPHARFRRVTVHLWQLEMPHRTKWQPTPFRAQLGELVDMLVTQFGWMLTDVTGNPDTTSDPDH